MGVATLVGKSRAQQWEWSAASVASERTGMGKTKRFSLDLATEVSAHRQVQKSDRDQLNKCKCRQLCPEAWLWR